MWEPLVKQYSLPEGIRDGVYTMEATQDDVKIQTRVEMWLRSCDGCMELVTKSMASTCGHLFCTMCLVEHGVTPPLTCPACNAALPDEAMENPTTTAITAALLMNHVPSKARMEVVQHMINASKELAHARRVELLTMLSEVRGRRIAQLERGMDSLMGLCTEQQIQMSLRDTAMSEMRARIEQLERERDIMARENIQLIHEMMRMRREMGARIAQLETDAAGRAISDSETETN